MSTVDQARVEIIDGVGLPYETNELYIDENESVFYKGAMHMTLNGKVVLVILTGGEVEVLCKLMGVDTVVKK